MSAPTTEVCSLCEDPNSTDGWVCGNCADLIWPPRPTS